MYVSKSKICIWWAMILLMTAGCGGSKQSTDDIIIVDVTKSYPKKEFILQDFMDVEYIALDSSDEFVTQGQVRAIGKDIILVMNRINDGDIFVFDKNGKGLRKINRRGNGGEEYLYTMNIVLDEDNGEIFIVDFRKTLVYDFYGKFKRSFQNNYSDVRNYDKENFISRYYTTDTDKDATEIPSFVITSKQDVSINKKIYIPFKKKKSVSITRADGNAGAGPGLINSIIPYDGSWILMEPSSDTVFKYLPDNSMIPFIVRTPTVQSMNPEVFLFPGILTDRYFFMRTVKKEYDFNTDIGFPTTHIVLDRQGKNLFEYTVYNSDFPTKKLLDLMKPTINDEIAFFEKYEAFELVEAYEKGELKGKLKEIAAELNEDSNPVIMLVKHKRDK